MLGKPINSLVARQQMVHPLFQHWDTFINTMIVHLNVQEACVKAVTAQQRFGHMHLHDVCIHKYSTYGHENKLKALAVKHNA